MPDGDGIQGAASDGEEWRIRVGWRTRFRMALVVAAMGGAVALLLAAAGWAPGGAFMLVGLLVMVIAVLLHPAATFGLGSSGQHTEYLHLTMGEQLAQERARNPRRAPNVLSSVLALGGLLLLFLGLLWALIT